MSFAKKPKRLTGEKLAAAEEFIKAADERPTAVEKRKRERVDMGSAKTPATFRYPDGLLQRARDIAVATDYSLNDLAVAGLQAQVETVLRHYEDQFGEAVPSREQRKLKG